MFYISILVYRVIFVILLVFFYISVVCFSYLLVYLDLFIFVFQLKLNKNDILL